MNGSLGKAFEVAFAAHQGQFDKSGAPYIAHVTRVLARTSQTGAAQIVALLHDVVEDTDVTLDQIEADFGAKIAIAVDAISRRDREQPNEYYARVRANPLALIVKLADIADNSDPVRLSALDPDIRDRLKAKYARALVQLKEAD